MGLPISKKPDLRAIRDLFDVTDGAMDDTAADELSCDMCGELFAIDPASDPSEMCAAAAIDPDEPPPRLSSKLARVRVDNCTINVCAGCIPDVWSEGAVKHATVETALLAILGFAGSPGRWSAI
jgi:hypothetical protein